MRSLRRADLALLLLLAGCATTDRPRPPGPATGAGAGAVKIGKPYQVFGIWYTPADDRSYDERGIASWYGPGFHALSTANGERYDQDAVTAAHKTLPLPSHVEVENLDNGRKLTVRINDRGPFVAGRIIDLSRRSAQLLGVDRAGLARVRVRRVFPDAATVIALAPPLRPQSPPPPQVLAPPPTEPVAPIAAVAAVAPVATIALPPATPRTPLTYVQVAALADPGRIAWLTGYLAGFGPVVTQAAPAGLTRIRLGPYAGTDEANAVLARVRAAGYSEARLTSTPPSP